MSGAHHDNIVLFGVWQTATLDNSAGSLSGVLIAYIDTIRQK
jgi:hypothetical protein